MRDLISQCFSFFLRGVVNKGKTKAKETAEEPSKLDQGCVISAGRKGAWLLSVSFLIPPPQPHEASIFPSGENVYIFLSREK